MKGKRIKAWCWKYGKEYNLACVQDDWTPSDYAMYGHDGRDAGYVRVEIAIRELPRTKTRRKR